MPIHGDLRTMRVAELLMWISQSQKTGTLEIRTAQATGTMVFDSGALVYSSSSNRDRTLGRLLIKYGVVSEENHKRARAAQDEIDPLLKVTQHKDEKGEYDFDSTGVHLENLTDSDLY